MVRVARDRAAGTKERHGSGDARVRDLISLWNKFAKTPVVPIHSAHPDQFETLFANAKRRQDGER
jgi:hypothetical protein